MGLISRVSSRTYRLFIRCFKIRMAKDDDPSRSNPACPDIAAQEKSSRDSIPQKCKKSKNPNSFLNGFIASTGAKSLTIPADRLKILIQSQQSNYKDVGLGRKNGNGLIYAFRNMYTELGWSGLYRSQSIALIRHGVHGGLGFFIRDNMQLKLNSRSSDKNGRHGIPRNILHFIIGACAGSGATLITLPLDTIRVKHTTNIKYSSYRQVWSDLSKPSTASLKSSKLFQNIFPVQLQNLYAGHVSAQFGVVIYAGCNFGFKDTITDYLYASHRDSFYKNGNFSTPYWYNSFLSGLVAAIVTQFVAYPMEVLKRRKQAMNVPYKDIVKGIFAEKSLQAKIMNVYRGFSINILRHPIVNGLVWLIKETLDQQSLAKKCD